MHKYNVLVIDSEPQAERQKRREHGRPTACESFIQALQRLAPQLVCDRATPVDGQEASSAAFTSYRAAFFAGSPLHFYDNRPEVTRVLRFAEALFGSGIPCFGSCAGLQIATMVAGGVVGPKQRQTELGIARSIALTPAGQSHKLLKGRPPAFDAPSIHGDEVKSLPGGAILLATSGNTRAQAAEMRVGASLFWGTQYHPEISLGEIALALEDQAQDAVAQGFSRDRGQLSLQLAKFKALHRDPERHDLAWEMGLDEQTTRFDARMTEMRNFVDQFVDPGRA